MKFADKLNRKSINLTAEELKKLMEVAYSLKKAIERGEKQDLDLMQTMRPMLLILLEYLVLNMDKPDVDISLINMIAQFLGIKLSTETEEDLEKEEENRLTKEEKERRHRLVIYEIYKIMNPRRLAGETPLDNFINNVKTKGFKTAMLYEGAEYSQFFKKDDIKALESLGFEFKSALDKAGMNVSVGRG